MKSIKSDSARTFFVILSLILLICLCGFRYETGKDYKSYLFLYSQPEELYTMKEVGFIWTIKMFNALSLPFSFFLFCIRNFYSRPNLSIYNQIFTIYLFFYSYILFFRKFLFFII